MTKKRPLTPQEKKAHSLKHDCRNTYGENDKASRRRVPQRKAEEHRRIRRKHTQDVAMLERLPEEQAVLLENAARTDLHRKGGWKKCAGTPLGDLVTNIKEARAEQTGSKVRRQAANEQTNALLKAATADGNMPRSEDYSGPAMRRHKAFSKELSAYFDMIRAGIEDSQNGTSKE